MRVVVLASLLVFAFGCNSLAQKARNLILKPSQLSADFKDLDKENPFEKPKTKVDSMKVDIASYDSFFMESAKVKGTVVLADVVLKETDEFIADTKKRIKAGTGLSPVQQKALAIHEKRVDSITKLLGGLPERADKLAGTGASLSKSAAKTFIGPNAFKLPNVVKGLDESAKDLQDATARTPKLLDHATKTAAALTSLK